MKFFEKKTIWGCDTATGEESAYLTRYTIFGCRFGQICIHTIHRSDADRDLHDHPWSFASVILWRGYIEHTPKGCRRLWPGMVNVRPLGCAHRVELIRGRKAVTLVLMGRRKREWGFFTKFGWKQWSQYLAEKNCFAREPVIAADDSAQGRDGKGEQR